MERDELYEILDIESGKDFQYFENIAALFESSEELGGEVIHELLTDIDMEVFGELVESYFDHIEDWIPEQETDFFTLITNIQRVMMGIIQMIIGVDDEEEEIDDLYMRLSEEIGNFRTWYSDCDNCECTNADTGETVWMPVRDALAHAKEEKLGGAVYHMDFSEAMGYELSDYMMSFADLTDLE